jgi:hypothetical protein
MARLTAKNLRDVAVKITTVAEGLEPEDWSELRKLQRMLDRQATRLVGYATALEQRV